MSSLNFLCLLISVNVHFWTLPEMLSAGLCWLLTVTETRASNNNGIIDYWPSFLCRCLQSFHCHEKYFRKQRSNRCVGERFDLLSLLLSGAWCAFSHTASVFLSDLQAKITVFTCGGASVSSTGHSNCFTYQYELKDIMNKPNTYTESYFTHTLHLSIAINILKHGDKYFWDVWLWFCLCWPAL